MSKKENVQDPVELQNVEAALGKGEAFVEEHIKGIAIAVGVLVLAVVAFFVVKYNVLAPREKKAQEAIYKGEEYFRQDSFKLAVEGDGVSYLGFEQIAKKYKWTKTAKIAKVYAAISYARMHESQKAIEALKGVSVKDKALVPMLKGLMGDCYVNGKDYKNAIACYKEAIKKADNDFVSPLYLQKLGVVYEFQGEYDKAVECYKNIKDQYPQSAQAYDIDRYIQAAEAMKQ